MKDELTAVIEAPPPIHGDDSVRVSRECLQTGSVQIHIRLSCSDAAALRTLARDRDQTLSATVRYLLKRHMGHLTRA